MEWLSFLEFEVRPSIRQVTNHGKSLEIGGRALDLLLFLIENRDRIVERDEIISSVWDGVAVGDNNLNVQVSTLRKLFGAGTIVTVPRRGLRFGVDVSLSPTQPGEPVLPLLPDKPSAAVLPFLDSGNEADYGWFADGMTEDITTELSRFHGLFVVARNSAFSYRGQHVDVRRGSRELGVRYVVEGSVPLSGLKLRVSAQLIDAMTGAHVWAERFDRTLKESFAVQDEVTRAVVAAIAPQIEGAEDQRIRRAPIENLGAYALARRAWSAEWPVSMVHDRRDCCTSWRVNLKRLCPNCAGRTRSIRTARSPGMAWPLRSNARRC